MPRINDHETMSIESGFRIRLATKKTSLKKFKTKIDITQTFVTQEESNAVTRTINE